MKKFKYKLDGLLKLRKFEEDKIKFALGRINNEIQRCLDEKVKLGKDIEEGFTTQESLLSDGTIAHKISYLPDLLIAKKNHLEQLNNYEEKLIDERTQLMLKLQKAHQNHKMLMNLKESEFQEFKKEYTKKTELNLEEINRLQKK